MKMRTKIKTFNFAKNESAKDVDHEINKFLKDKELVDIKVNELSEYTLHYTVIYRNQE